MPDPVGRFGGGVGPGIGGRGGMAEGVGCGNTGFGGVAIPDGCDDCRGSAISCRNNHPRNYVRMVKLILPYSSTFFTRTLITWPTFNASDGLRIFSSVKISVTCTNPSLPGMYSTSAPKSSSLVTRPSNSSPAFAS